jgi:antimicrobial peptide system SdpB family protein
MDVPLLYARKNILNEKIAVIRAVAACGALLTLLFNNVGQLIQKLQVMGKDEIVDTILIQKISLFNLLPPVYAKYVGILILLAVISGYYPKITCFLHAWICLSITNSFVPLDGGDQIAANLSLLLIPVCICDARTNQWSKPINKDPGINVFTNVAFFFIQFQAAVIYLHSAIGKLATPEWINGTATYYWLSNPIFGAPDWLRHMYETVTLSKWVFILTWSVMAFELALFACILAPKQIKRFFLKPAIAFHFFIILTHGLFSFFFAITALLIAYLDDSNDSIKFAHSFFRRFGRNTTTLPKTPPPTLP